MCTINLIINWNRYLYYQKIVTVSFIIHASQPVGGRIFKMTWHGQIRFQSINPKCSPKSSARFLFSFLFLLSWKRQLRKPSTAVFANVVTCLRESWDKWKKMKESITQCYKNLKIMLLRNQCNWESKGAWFQRFLRLLNQFGNKPKPSLDF